MPECVRVRPSVRCAPEGRVRLCRCVCAPRPLRAGHEKEDGETAGTVGCCSLRVEHVQLHPEADGCPYVVESNFLGKDLIRYYNKEPVEKLVSAWCGRWVVPHARP